MKQMINEYDFKKVEKKWQDIWEKEKRYAAITCDKSRPKYYVLVEFPYPSGSGLHCGHTPNQIGMDIIARKKRAEGYNVLYPIGFDSFGLPTENYAIKTGRRPKDITKENVAYFTKQIKSMGISFDWDRTFCTTDEDYYKWTQWLFIQFYKHGLAYKEKANINWCPSCKVGLSNEESEGGVCERCGATVEQRAKEQWILKMSEYSEKLLQGLEKTDYWESIKASQRNWIGKSEGVQVKFDIKQGGSFEIFTTCIETIYGITFMVLAPENELVQKLKDKIANWKKVEEYIKETNKKSEFERSELSKGKTGCELKGLTAINPVNGKEVPIYIADFVLAGYGTGAVMAVPSHDQRDFEFAIKHNIPMIQVISGRDVDKCAFEKLDYLGTGAKLINSKEFSGLTVEEAKEKITEKLIKMGVATKQVNYKMRDWIFSRQRYWGEPVPMIKCESCGWVPVPEKDLPVKLPEIEGYKPTDDGESPLSKIDSWVNTKCPVCGHPAKRETDVMPNWAGSSWYWLRYMDPHNDKEFASMDAMKYWGMVDLYNGGGEHVTRHLLYARFWHKFFYDIGLVPTEEPFMRRIQQGLILASDGTKMSKSKGNTVDPMKYVEEYGADVARLGQMFMGDYTATKPWSDDTMKPCQRLLFKVRKFKEKLVEGDIRKEQKFNIATAIKDVTEDIDTLKFNTAISAIMILSNALEAEEKITTEEYKILLKLLNPFAPHITEELWEECSFNPQIEKVEWPKYNEKDLVKNIINLPVQVCGKMRGLIDISADMTQDEIVELIKKEANISKYLTSSIKKVIYIPNKIINIII